MRFPTPSIPHTSSSALQLSLKPLSHVHFLVIIWPVPAWDTRAKDLEFHCPWVEFFPLTKEHSSLLLQKECLMLKTSALMWEYQVEISQASQQWRLEWRTSQPTLSSSFSVTNEMVLLSTSVALATFIVSDIFKISCAALCCDVPGEVLPSLNLLVLTAPYWSYELERKSPVKH